MKENNKKLDEGRSAVWVRSGKIGNTTWDEYVIVEGDSGIPLDRDDPRFFEHHPEGYDNH